MSTGKYQSLTVKQRHESKQNDAGYDLRTEMSDVLGKMTEQDIYKAMFDLQQRLRTKDLQKLEHIKKYKKARKMHQDIQDAMVDYFEQGKFEHKIDSSYFDNNLDEYRTGKRTFDLIKCSFDMESDLGVRTFYDLVIYKSAPNMNSITEEFIAKKRYRKPEKNEFLQSMLNSTIGLFEVVKIEVDTAYVTLKNVFTGQEFKILDIGLSGSPGADRNYLYTRIITYKETSFGTGFSMLFPKTDAFICKFISTEKKKPQPLSEIARMTKLYKRRESVDTMIELRSSNPFERRVVKG